MLRKLRIKTLYILVDEKLWGELGCCGGKRKDPAGWWNTDLKLWGSFDQACVFDLQCGVWREY